MCYAVTLMSLLSKRTMIELTKPHVSLLVNTVISMITIGRDMGSTEIELEVIKRDLKIEL